MRFVFPITLKHHFDFGDERELVGTMLTTPEAWDALRLDSRSLFAVDRTPEEMLATIAQHPNIQQRMQTTGDWIQRHDVTSVVSYGAGVGIAEACLHRVVPELRLTVTEFAPGTVDRLKRILPAANVVHHDLLQDPPIPADLHIWHRVDPEFTNKQLSDILRRFAGQRILVIAAEVAGWRRFYAELRYIRNHPGPLTHAGWLRNRKAYERILGRYHMLEPVRFHDLNGWVLRPNRA